MHAWGLAEFCALTNRFFIGMDAAEFEARMYMRSSEFGQILRDAEERELRQKSEQEAILKAEEDRRKRPALAKRKYERENSTTLKKQHKEHRTGKYKVNTRSLPCICLRFLKFLKILSVKLQLLVCWAGFSQVQALCYFSNLECFGLWD